MIFDKSKLERIGKIYDLSIEVMVTDKIDQRQGTEEGKEVNNGTHGTHGTDVGLDKHFYVDTSFPEMIESQENIDNNSN